MNLSDNELSTLTPSYDPLIPPLIQMVGRKRELSSLRMQLCEGLSYSICGLPGVGKTTLAVALAHDQSIRCAFPDGILWVGLGTNPDVIGQLRRWASVLGIFISENGFGIRECICAAIGERRMLLVIDDVWKIEDALQFQIGGPNCVHLLTTRVPHIADHLSSANAMVLRELNLEQSLDLLNTLASYIVQQESEKIRTLASTVGGLPLALTLIGNYLRLHSLGGQSRRIATALEYLNKAEARLYLAEPQGPADRHPNLQPEQPHSLHSIIAFSEQPLSQVARTAFYALSILPHKPQTFSEAAARAVCACSPTIIDNLVDAGLVECAGDGRYTLHQTIADYAHAHLSDPHPGQRLLSYTLAFIKEHATEYDLLDQESSTILVSLEIAYQQGCFADLIQGVCTFTPYLLARANYVLAEQHLQRAHEASLSLGSQKDSIKILLLQGQLMQKKSNYVQSQNLLQQGLSLAISENDDDMVSALLRDLGRTLIKRGELRLAETYLLEGLALAQKMKNSKRSSELLAILGTVSAKTGNIRKSEIYLREGLELAQQVGNQEDICMLFINLGTNIAEQGDFLQARNYLEEGLKLARKIRHYEFISALLCNLGAVATYQGKYEIAATYQREGLDIARQTHQREWINILLLNLGETAILQQQFNKAEFYFLETLTLAQQLDRPQIITKVFYEMGNLYLLQEQCDKAEVAFHEMQRTLPKDDQELEALLYYGQARMSAIQGQVEKAHQLGSNSASMLEKIGHHEARKVRYWLESITI